MNSEKNSLSSARANTDALTMIADMSDSERRRHAARMALVRKARKHAKDIAACIEAFGGKFSEWDASTLYWVVNVDSFAAALPLIELAESFFGDCVSSQDWPEYRQRDFTLGWLRIACTLKDDSESCKVVVKGFKEPEPILEFVCAGAAA